MKGDPTPLNKHGQPANPAFHHHQNKNKALQDLLGVIQGMAADREINAAETVFLDAWLRDNSNLSNNPNYIDLIDLTTDVLADGLITEEESQDLLGLISCILEDQTDTDFANDKQAVQRLLGICKGMASDLKLRDLEILTLGAWLKHSEIWTDNPIANQIRDQLRRMLKDGVITEGERRELLTTLQQVSGSSLEDGITGGMSLRLDWDTPDLSFVGKSFCFTGQMSYGTRAECHEITKEQGGTIHKSVLKKTDYLVIGELFSRDWVHSSFGRKIEKAFTYKEKGSSVAIIEERLLMSYISP